MVNSMTGFAARGGSGAGYRWAWDMRSVNAKGMDLRLRLPDWVAGLEQGARGVLAGAVARGNVTLNLRLSREGEGGGTRLDAQALNGALALVAQVQAAAEAQGLVLAPTRASDILGMRGVQDASAGDEDTAALLKVLLTDLPALVTEFNAMRAQEGAALARLLREQLDRVETLVDGAESIADGRRAQWAAQMADNLARVMAGAPGADADRVAQELALIAVKSDVTEEIDRLRTHVGAARALLDQDGPRGRKLDFLMQEFNREANTLCAKAQDSDLTALGLDLKAVIDQMREQVQNVE